jgi:tagaturonate epimerase
MKIQSPRPLGLVKSFGYGDRLGLATPGHLAAHRKYDFAPIFAQQSIREMTRTERSPDEVMEASRRGLTEGGYEGVWGADADHLKNLDDARRASGAGFCFFTIDPSEYVENGADSMNEADLAASTGGLVIEGVFDSEDWRERYVGRSFDLGEGVSIAFTAEAVERAAVKYARAIAYTQRMAEGIATIRGDEPFEIEVSVDETDTPTSVQEHLFFGLELKRRGVKVVSLAPRFPGDFEKGIDYRGDIGVFESSLRQHVAIARYCGPYKISVHSGSDKFGIYPAIGRICGDLLHVKTAGTSYLEALRCVLRVDPDLFREIATYCFDRFDEDRKSYHISTTTAEVTALARGRGSDEKRFLDERPGRQLLHVTFGSVLTRGTARDGRPFKEAILEILSERADLHTELIERHFERHLAELTRG